MRSDHDEPPTIRGFAPRGHDGKKTVLPADVLAKFAGPIIDTIRRDMRDREFLYLCEARGGGR